MARLWCGRAVPVLAVATVAALLGQPGVVAQEADTSSSASLRSLQVSTSDLIKAGPRLLHDDYMHARYNFKLDRQNMHREGAGEMWLAFGAGGVPKMRLRGTARSPRFGDGEITIVVDAADQRLYARFVLKELHESQCVTYPFPKPEENAERMAVLRERLRQVQAWQSREAKQWGTGAQLLSVNWTANSVLDFLLAPDGTEVQGVDLKRGDRVIKTVRLVGVPERSSSVPEEAEQMFAAPASDCIPADELADPFAQVELRPPHRKSSALNDLLLVLADHLSDTWSQLFIILSALVVPGDVAVMIEDPAPPHPELLGGVAFDYVATVNSHGVQHTSEGSVWLNLEERTFRLRGEAKQTKVGPLIMDLVARSGADPKVYAHVNLTAEAEHQCVEYDYPQLTFNVTTELEDLSRQGLTFFAIAQYRGEDCGIFVAPLARGRWIHVWVDLEADNPNAFLRSEIFRRDQLLRSTDILRWHAGEDIRVTARPQKEWGCKEETPTDQLAHLGLRQVHRRSIELQDALYSLHNLPSSFSVLEILGLTGDVAIMVEEPTLPQLWLLPSVSFTFALYLGPASEVGFSDSFTHGSFAGDLTQDKFRLTAGGVGPNISNVSIAIEPGLLAVRVQRSPGEVPQCLTIPLEDTLVSPPQAVSAGMFDGVEAVGNAECNRFTFLPSGDRGDSVEFWYSMEDQAVCRIELLPPPGNTVSPGAVIDVPIWAPKYIPGGNPDEPAAAGLAAAPFGWYCEPAASMESPWLTLGATQPPDALAAGVALSKLAEGAGVVGLLPASVAKTLSQLVITPPPPGAPVVPGPPIPVPEVPVEPPPPPISIFSPELRNFTFSYTSSYPLQIRGGSFTGGVAFAGDSSLYGTLRQRGSGELRVDLARRRMFLRSEARNVSAGISLVESRVIFRGDRGRLYARTRIDADNFAQCWSVRTVEAVPAPPGGVQPNPFTRGRPAGGGYSVPGLSGRPADKYVFHLDQRKRVALFVNDQAALVAMNVDDLSRDVTAGILVSDWSTAPIDDSWFEPGSDWNCHDQQIEENPEQLAEWDLIRMFFPVDPIPMADEFAAPAGSLGKPLWQ